MAEPQELGYAAALAELESILAELEDDEVDVDVLATRVARAGELIQVCRTRLEQAEVEVSKIQVDLED